MAKTKPRQTEPLIDPANPESGVLYTYLLLEEMHSPPVSTPNAIRWEEYARPEYLNLDNIEDDRRVALGIIVYGRRLGWDQLALYNLYPVNPAEAALFDLWREFGRDADELTNFLDLVFTAAKDDPLLHRLQLAIRLIRRSGWNLEKATEVIEKIERLVKGEEE